MLQTKRCNAYLHSASKVQVMNKFSDWSSFVSFLPNSTLDLHADSPSIAAHKSCRCCLDTNHYLVVIDLVAESTRVNWNVERVIMFTSNEEKIGRTCWNMSSTSPTALICTQRWIYRIRHLNQNIINSFSNLTKMKRGWSQKGTHRVEFPFILVVLDNRAI